jgi:hypothetical protein
MARWAFLPNIPFRDTGRQFEPVLSTSRFKPDASLESAANVTIIHNGIVVHNHASVIGAMA